MSQSNEAPKVTVSQRLPPSQHNSCTHTAMRFAWGPTLAFPTTASSPLSLSESRCVRERFDELFSTAYTALLAMMPCTCSCCRSVLQDASGHINACDAIGIPNLVPLTTALCGVYVNKSIGSDMLRSYFIARHSPANCWSSLKRHRPLLTQAVQYS
jgi:hypothetical protein